MAEVFISYHERSAGGLAAQIADALEAGGITCWYAKRDIPTGGDFARAIPTQIDACKVFLLVLTKDAQTSKHIESELGLAFSRANRGEDITIFPIEIGDFEKESWIRYYLIHAQILKCAVLDAERMQELARRVAKHLNRELPAQILKRGECGDNVTYTLDEDGVLTISGEGAMWDFHWDFQARPPFLNTPWSDETQTISHVEIYYGVTSIGKHAFYCCTELASVAISNSVTSIGDTAFYRCTKLTSVTIPDSVTSIGYAAFSYCTSLASVAISNSNSMTSIERSTFEQCKELTSVHIPSSVTSIGDSAFDGCTRLKSVTIPDSVTYIGHAAFGGCAELKGIIIPNGVSAIADFTFSGCTGLTSVAIPDSITYIGKYAFYDCLELTSVSVPKKIIIGKGAFPYGVIVTHRT